MKGKHNDFSISVLRKRLFAVFMAITFLFLFIIGRYFYVQILWRDWLVYKALDQCTRELPIVAKRGIITDRNGFALVENTTKYTVFARSNAVKEKQKRQICWRKR